MTTLVSPGVQTQIVDESFYIPGRQTTTPLIFIATAEEKVQADGLTPALGTFESGVVRVVTSIRQALDLYGVPNYYRSADGLPHHGDARNEYGLDALMKFLEVGNRAYVVRANVNLNDNYQDVKRLWTGKIADAADDLFSLVGSYIAEFNRVNGLLPSDLNYKRSVTRNELKQLINQVLAPVFNSYSFSSDLFALRFLRDTSFAYAGYQDVVFETAFGQIQNSDATGFENDTTPYGAEIRVVSSAGTNIFNVTVAGEQAQTFGQLLTRINAVLGATATASLVAGRLRIMSTLTGATSSVQILTDGPSGALPLFRNLNLFKEFALAVPGEGPAPLTVYDDTFTNILGSYTGLDGRIDSWTSGAIIPTQFNSVEAQSILVGSAADFDNTREFRNETSLGANDAARRAEIVARLQAEVNSATSGIRAESLEYNLIACPGYPEVADEMARLSTDMKGEVFAIGETPFDRPPTGPNGIDRWAVSPAKVASPYIAYYYGHGLSSNIDGETILTTASATALRTFAFNDSESEVWFAPAGIQRGRCEHLTTVGYVSGVLGGPTTFVEDFLDDGSRDTLYEAPKNINPITFIPDRGILVFGQKTTSPVASALDRVNVARMICYIRRELRKGMFAYLFEPNDKLTRDQAKSTAVNFLADLVNRRGLYDFAVLVDETNNSPDRIDRNELWVDIALKPVKAVEYIIIPIRIVRTGTDLGTGRPIPNQV